MGKCDNPELQKLEKEIEELKESRVFYKHQSYELKKELDKVTEDRDNKKSIAMVLLTYMVKLLHLNSTNNKKEYEKLIIEVDKNIKKIFKENILG